MSKVKSIVEALNSEDNFTHKTQLASYLLNVMNNTTNKQEIEKSELDELVTFLFEEIDELIALLPKTHTYKEKDNLAAYADRAMGLLSASIEKGCTPERRDLDRVSVLSNIISEFRKIENSVDEMFNTDDVYRNGKIEKTDIDRVINVVKTVTDEYYRGKLYQGLLHYNQKINLFTDDAKAVLADYFCSEFDRIIKKGSDITEDIVNSLEIAVDVCYYFINAKIIEQLKKILDLNFNNVRFYTISTLLKANESVDAKFVAEMASDLVYAEMTYFVLKNHKKEGLFPKEYATPEYLAKSDLVHWLTYPTELGKAPDKIELLGDVKVKGEIYYLFKYMSDSDTLDDEVKNQWLVGWSSSEGGGTFSNFDKLSLFEKKTIGKTLKQIKKKLL